MAGKTAPGKEYEPNGNEEILTYELTYKDVVDILKLIDRSACREVRIELGDFKLTVVKRGYPVTSAAAVPPELDHGPRSKVVSKKEGL